MADTSLEGVEGEREVGGDTAEGELGQEQELPEVKYEYLDHTSDIQIHSWGDSLEEAFEQSAMGMFGYMTDIERVDNLGSEEIEAEGTDLISLLFHFLDEFLFIFNADPNFIARKVEITSFDRTNFRLRAVGYGETFNLRKHTQGTEVKAITYSNMQIHEKEDGKTDIYVIVDI